MTMLIYFKQNDEKYESQYTNYSDFIEQHN